MKTLLVLLVLCLAAPSWADSTEDVKACQAQTATLAMQLLDAKKARMAYVAKLGEMLAETREQLDQALQELQRLKEHKP